MKYDMPFLMNILDKIVETNLGHSSLSRRLKRIDSSVLIELIGPFFY
ncbi:hypothetical protein [Enterococcus durans]|nr:hypothetical protein [Enterococcus durans]MCB8515442.1 hypothetical protein [Enterococcus durans]